MNVLPNEISEYIRLQTALLNALPMDVGVSTKEYFNDVIGGEVVVDGTSWAYRGHGRGVTFEAKTGGTIVNVHVAPFLPDAIDSWRLELYFESLGGGDVQRRRSSDDIKNQLEELARVGLLKEATVGDAPGRIVVYRPTRASSTS